MKTCTGDGSSPMGQWDGTAPHCTGKDKIQTCHIITFAYMCTAVCHRVSLTNGMVSYSPDTTLRLEGTVATHSCDVGYVLSGGVNRTCQSDGKWTGGSITCEGENLAV